MSLSAKEAAELVGVSKSAILKAIKTGKISATKNQNDEWRIEPVELFRRYDPVGDVPQQSAQQSAPSSAQGTQHSTEGVQQEVAQLRAIVARLEARLDAEQAERRALLALLTDSRHAAPAEPSPQPVESPTPRRSWWARVLGRE